MPKTILFDIGNVLLFFDFNRALEKIGIASETIDPATLESFFALRDQIETGSLGNSEFIAKVAALTAFTGSMDELSDAYCDIFTPNEAMWKIVRETAGNARRILFSNTSSLHIDFIHRRYPDFSLFDDAVYSFEVGHSKPESPMYQDALDRLKIDPDDTFYIDDLLANVETGDQFGFKTHHYVSSRHHDLVTDLHRFLSA